MRAARIRLTTSLLLGVVLFLAVGWSIDRAGAAPIAFFGGTSPALRYEMLRRMPEPVEVLAIGPSFVAQGFDAARFGERTGRTSFNFGIEGSDLYYQSRLVRTVFLPLHRPRVLLWGMRDTTLSRRKLNAQLLASPSLRFSGDAWDRRAFQMSERLPHYRRRRLTDWVAALLRSEPESVDRLGQTRIGQTMRADAEPVEEGDEEAGDAEEEELEGRGEVPGKLEEYYVSVEEGRAYFEETLRLLTEAGVEVWILFTPYHQQNFEIAAKYTTTCLTGSAELYSSWLPGALQAAGVPLLNLRYCAEISPHAELFSNSRHLNEAGAARFTDLLAELMASAGPVPEEWSGMPSQAEERAIFGELERESLHRLKPGRRYALRDLRRRADGSPSENDAYARVTVETPGAYRIGLVDRQASEHAGIYLLRMGANPFVKFKPPPGAHRSVAAGIFLLPAGEHLLEIHGRTTAVDWDELLVDRPE